MLTPDHDQTKTNHIGSVYLMLFDESELNFDVIDVACLSSDIHVDVVRFIEAGAVIS